MDRLLEAFQRNQGIFRFNKTDRIDLNVINQAKAKGLIIPHGFRSSYALDKLGYEILESGIGWVEWQAQQKIKETNNVVSYHFHGSVQGSNVGFVGDRVSTQLIKEAHKSKTHTLQIWYWIIGIISLLTGLYFTLFSKTT